MSTQINSTPIASQIAKRKSNKAILIGISLVVVGIGLYLLSTAIADHSSSLYMLCVVGGFAAMGGGVLKLCFGGKEIVYLPTKSPVKSYTLYFDSLDSDRLVELIEKRKLDDLRTARRKESGPVRLDVQRSKDDRFVALQVMQYIPYSYETVSGTYYFHEEMATQVASCVGNPAK